ncbi:MAG: DUF3575 domain-containing protein [Muribaculaceae bacterium]|nr:DUF3575 domain-containing protein [Muribaculaceae bacterium]
MKRLLAYTVVLFVAFAAFGQIPTDSVNVYFRIGHRQFDPTLNNNRESMSRFVDQVREAKMTGDFDRIVVRAYSSPAGLSKADQQLAVDRCQVLTDYIAGQTGINRDLIQSERGGIRWDELRRLVAENPDVPAREKVLDIIDNTPVLVYNSDGKIVGGRNRQLMNLEHGIPYRWMYEHIFPELGNGLVVVLYTTTPVDSAATERAEPSEKASDLKGADRFAVKTNLLYDVALLPNLEFEWLINKRWSIAREGGVAWWNNDHSHKTYELAYVTPEVRYHIKNRAPWHGAYVGVMAGGGLYDFENGGNGYQGEGAMAGLTIGYMWPVGKHLSLEAAVGAGYLYTRYKEYEPRDGHYLYMRTKSLHYFGPLKLKFAIAWRFGGTKKPLLNTPAL